MSQIQSITAVVQASVPWEAPVRTRRPAASATALSRTRRLLCGLVIATAGPAVLACSDSPPLAEAPPNVSEAVTGEAARALDAEGRFVLAAPAQVDQSEISADQARALATTYVAQFGSSFKEKWERGRGAPVDVGKLHPCGRVFYAATVFEPLPAEVPKAYHRYFGSWWIVGMCGPNGDLQVSQAVSALATEVRVVDGRLDFGRSDGTEFFTLGVPSDWDSPVGVSPERAVDRAAHRTGRRLTEVPTLTAVAPALGYPQRAMWRLGLEEPVRVHTKKSQRDVSERVFYAGLHHTVGREGKGRALTQAADSLWVPIPEQPNEQVMRYVISSPTEGPNDQPAVGTMIVRRKADRPVIFEAAVVEQGGGQ